MKKTMNALECKEKFLSVVDEIAATGESIVVMRNGRPVGRIQPFVAGRKESPRLKKVVARGR